MPMGFKGVTFHFYYFFKMFLHYMTFYIFGVVTNTVFVLFIPGHSEGRGFLLVLYSKKGGGLVRRGVLNTTNADLFLEYLRIKVLKASTFFLHK